MTNNLYNLLIKKVFFIFISCSLSYSFGICINDLNIKKDEIRKKIGHRLEDLLISCKFNGNACTFEDFSWKFDRYFGNCFIFNSGKNNLEQSIELKKSFIPHSLSYKYI